jgi:hypothetical protein
MIRRKRKQVVEAKRQAELKRTFIIIGIATVLILILLFMIYKAAV